MEEYKTTIEKTMKTLSKDLQKQNTQNQKYTAEIKITSESTGKSIGAKIYT